MTEEEFRAAMGQPAQAVGQPTGVAPQTAQVAPGSTNVNTTIPTTTPGPTPGTTDGFRKIETLGPPAIDIKKQPGTSFEGKYTGCRAINTRIGPNNVYQFQGPYGPYGVYGFTMLNRAMEQVQVGQTVRLTYTGTTPTKNKMGATVNMHNVNVEVK